MNAFQTNTREKFDFVGLRWLWFSISAITLGIGLVFLLTRGLNLGLDYTGGGEVSFYTGEGHELPPIGTDERARLANQMRDAVSRTLGLDCQVRLYEESHIGVQFRAQTEDELESRTQTIRQTLDAEFADIVGQVRGGDPEAPELFDTRFIGPKIGKELRTNGLKALFWGSLMILLFIWWRFELQFGVAAIVALLHDAFIVLGVFAMGHWEIDLAFIAAVLTILGYSVNDSVVIFDRIRENLGARRRIVDYDGVVNDSLFQTLPRSINTVGTTLMVLIFLFFLGGESIHTFALALMVGIASGAYSSIFNAAQVVVQWRHIREARTGKAPTAKSMAERQTAAAAGNGDGVLASDTDSAMELELSGAPATGLDTTKARAQASKATRTTVATRRKSKKRH